MKKRAKKLVLAKETVLELEPGRIVGGITENLCPISNQASCGCESGACAATNPSNRFICR